jgi:quercetin dioxygenase-like cupin family protein
MNAQEFIRIALARPAVYPAAHLGQAKPPRLRAALYTTSEGDMMRIKKYPDVEATYFDKPDIKGVAARVVIGKNDGAHNFCMRIFDISPGGNTPKHVHDWEHEMFVHAGEGEIYGNGQWHPVKSGNVLFIPGDLPPFT